MSWIKNSLSCFQCNKRNRCECSKKVGSKPSNNGNVPTKSEVSDKNIQCDFDNEEFSKEHVENLICDKGQ